MGLLERFRGRRRGAEPEPVRVALAVLRVGGIEARLLDAPAGWEALRRGGAACACVLEPELRRDQHGGLRWPLLLRFSPGSEFAHLSEWQPLAERIVAALGGAGFEARWRGGRSDLIELFPPRRTG